MQRVNEHGIYTFNHGFQEEKEWTTSHAMISFHLTELHVPGLPVSQLTSFSTFPVTGDEVKADADVLQFEPVKELEGGRGARPVQNCPQLIDEGQGTEDLEPYVAPGVHMAHEDECVPASSAPACKKKSDTW